MALERVAVRPDGYEETDPCRTQPDRLIAAGKSLILGGIAFLASDFGETESGADTV